MNLITRIAVIGCTGLFAGTTAAATVDLDLPFRTMLALAVAAAVWIVLGRLPVQGGEGQHQTAVYDPGLSLFRTAPVNDD